MPELPEVEVTRLGFAHEIQGAVIQGSFWGKPLRWPLGCPPELLSRRRVQSVGRRGKYLLVHLDVGLLMVHLGMSGSLRFGTDLPPAGAHDHFRLYTDQGELRLHDPRRFGAVVYAAGLDDPMAKKLLDRLGMEPLSAEFDADKFVDEIQACRSSIKQVLLSGAVVVGVGNIYACEVLFGAGIRPDLSAARVGRARLRKLHVVIQRVLAQAVAAGGSTLRDFADPHGQAGHFQAQAVVYGREGQPCFQCGSAIMRTVQAQRSTYHCPTCQAR